MQGCWLGLIVNFFPKVDQCHTKDPFLSKKTLWVKSRIIGGVYFFSFTSCSRHNFFRDTSISLRENKKTQPYVFLDV